MGWWTFAQANPPPRKRDANKEEIQALVLNNLNTERMVQERKLLVCSWPNEAEGRVEHRSGQDSLAVYVELVVKIQESCILEVFFNSTWPFVALGGADHLSSFKSANQHWLSFQPRTYPFGAGVN